MRLLSIDTDGGQAACILLGEDVVPTEAVGAPGGCASSSPRSMRPA